MKHGLFCAGEAFDKVARLLGLQLDPSGGAAVEALAREGDDQRFRFSRPLSRKPNCNFSYAGLKTAVRLAINAELQGPPSEADRQVRHTNSIPCTRWRRLLFNVSLGCSSQDSLHGAVSH